jgi:hypothetical protein
MAECLGARRPAGLGGNGGPVLERPLAVGLVVVPFAGDPVPAGAEAFLALVDRWCAVSPVVLVAEDLQWSDLASVVATAGGRRG